MGKLAEYVRTEAEHLRAEAQRKNAAVAEWKEAVERLYAQLDAWITEADGGHKLLMSGPGSLVSRREPKLGTYEIRTLRITLGIRSVEVVPKSRYVVATIAPPGLEPCRADGMVELTDGGMADHYVFRLVVGGEDRWYIRSVGLWNTDDKRTVETLDRDRFEAAVLYTLQ